VQVQICTCAFPFPSVLFSQPTIRRDFSTRHLCSGRCAQQYATRQVSASHSTLVLYVEQVRSLTAIPYGEAPVLRALRPAGLHHGAVPLRASWRDVRPQPAVHHVEQHLLKRTNLIGLT